MNEEVRQALAALWQAQRVLLAAQAAEGEAEATAQAAQGVLRERETASRRADDEVRRVLERLYQLARQAEKEEAG